jgi:Protein of unknown function (DUF3037)
MADLRKFDFFLLRYTPNAVRDESVNIGLVMTERGGDGGGFADVYFTTSWARVQSLDPTVDIDLLEAFGREIKNKFVSASDRVMLLNELLEHYSNSIQLSPVISCMAEDPVREMKYLASNLVEAVTTVGDAEKMGRSQKTSGRPWIYQAMTDEFKVEGIWELLNKDIPASPYTVEGDPLTFDYSYQFGNKMKIFQAVSFVERVSESVNFARAFAGLAPTLAQQKAVEPVFTAVVENQYDASDKNVKLAIAFIENAKGRVAKLSEMHGITETARLELRA